MPAAPTGTVTLLFTDIEGSTRLLHDLGPEAYAEELAVHRRVLRTAFARHGGVEIDTQGDAFFVAFAQAPAAVEAAQTIKSGLARGLIRVRMGLHTGTPLWTDEGYVGSDVHQAARIAATGHGGQVVVSPTTAELVREDFTLAPLGTHRLKDFDDPVSLFQLGKETFPPLKTIANSNLPTPVSSFLGRESELFEASRTLSRTRLLTVTGPGGAGKTRFALELARSAREERFADYRDGIFWVPLAALRDPALVLDTVAHAIGAKEGLHQYIAHRKMLLLLDNFEQVVEAARELSELLEVCSNLSILVTSREVLHIRGEVEYKLPPLAEQDGVLLFSERAQQEPSEDMRELCRRLDGLPLAIELAAARTRMLSPAEMVERLSERLDILQGGRDMDPRQQTLRAAIEWSHELLAEEERRVFRRLSVFAGSCTFESAAAVADADLYTLQSLFDKSLLRRSEDGHFFMLETIREYAYEQLERSAEIEMIRRRHGRFIFGFAQDALAVPDRSEGARRLERHRGNLRAALTWSLETGESKISLVLATAYARICIYRGPFSEGRYWLDAALDGRGGEKSAERVRALLAAAGLAGRQRDDDRAWSYAESGLRLARSVGDSEGVGTALLIMGVSRGVAGVYDSSESFMNEALAVFSRIGDDWHIRETLALLGWVALARQDYGRARSVIGEALDLSRQADDLHGIFYGVTNLAHVAAREHRFEEALELLREGLLLGQQQDVQSEADTLQDLAAVAAAQAQYEEAAVLLGGADALREGTEAKQEQLGQGLHGELVLTLRGNLREDLFAAACERGRAMTLEQIVVYGVQFIDSTRAVSRR